MGEGVKLDKLCQGFVSLDAGEKDYIIGISRAPGFFRRAARRFIG
ncbi:hypothetical protein FACS189483_11070 [Spirochaetia bacterium]|nr:hypothetical protein FACS189483_11070 [Spirochaetia bacterium]